MNDEQAYNILDQVQKRYLMHNKYVVIKELKKAYHIRSDEPLGVPFNTTTWQQYCNDKMMRLNKL